MEREQVCVVTGATAGIGRAVAQGLAGGGAEVEGVTGGYFAKRRQVEPSEHSRDPEIGRRLWEASERLAGLVPG